MGIPKHIQRAILWVAALVVIGLLVSLVEYRNKERINQVVEIRQERTDQDCILFYKEWYNDYREYRDSQQELRSQQDFLADADQGAPVDSDLAQRIRELIPETKQRVEQEHREYVDSRPPVYCPDALRDPPPGYRTPTPFN
jgi:hypothetical protein